MPLEFKDPYGGGTPDVGMGQSSIRPRETYAVDPHAINSQYQEKVRNAEDLHSAMSKFGGSLDSLAANQLAQEKKTAADGAANLANQISGSISSSEPVDLQTRKLLPSASPLATAAVSEYLGKQQGAADAQSIIENMPQAFRDDPKAAQTYFQNEAAKRANKDPQQLFYGNAYSSSMNDHFTAAQAGLSAQRNAIMSKQLDDKAKDDVFTNAAAAVDTNKIPIDHAPDPVKAQSVINHANALGISAMDLTIAMSYETGGKLSADTAGGGAASGRIGLIQFGKEEAIKYGVHPGMTFDEQMNSVTAYLKDRGVKPGMGLLDIYSTINAGKPGLPDFKDSNPDGKTVAQRVAQMKVEHNSSALKFFGLDADPRMHSVSGKGSSSVDDEGITSINTGFAAKFGSMTETKGMIIHHTGGGGDVNGVISTLKDRGLGVQFVVDREGKTYRLAPDGAAAAHMRNGWGDKGQGLSNSNMQGVEVIAKNDKDVTPAQIAAVQKLVALQSHKFGYDPKTSVFGHGEVNPGHKESDEGMSSVNAIRNGPAVQVASLDPTSGLEQGTGTAGTAIPTGSAANEPGMVNQASQPDASHTTTTGPTTQVARTITGYKFPDGTTVHARGPYLPPAEVLDSDIAQFRAGLLHTDSTAPYTSPGVPQVRMREHMVDASIERAEQLKDTRYLKAVPATMLLPSDRARLDAAEKKITSDAQTFTAHQLTMQTAQRKLDETQWLTDAMKFNEASPGAGLPPEMVKRATALGAPELVTKYNSMRTDVQNALVNPKDTADKLDAINKEQLRVAAMGGDPSTVSRDGLPIKEYLEAQKSADDVAKHGGEMSHTYYHDKWKNDEQSFYDYQYGVIKDAGKMDPNQVKTEDFFRQSLYYEIGKYSQKFGAPINDSQRNQIYIAAREDTLKAYPAKNAPAGPATSINPEQQRLMDFNKKHNLFTGAK